MSTSYAEGPNRIPLPKSIVTCRPVLNSGMDTKDGQVSPRLCISNILL